MCVPSLPADFNCEFLVLTSVFIQTWVVSAFLCRATSPAFEYVLSVTPAGVVGGEDGELKEQGSQSAEEQGWSEVNTEADL